MSAIRLPKPLVKDIFMNTPCLKQNDPVISAVKIFIETKLSLVPIIREDHSLAGVFTKSHLFKMILDGKSLYEPLEYHMEQKVSVVHSDEPLGKVVERLPSAKVGQFVVLDNANKVVGILAHINMVRLLLETTRVMSHELETVVERMHNGLIAINEAGYITIINLAACKIFKVNSQEVIGQHVTQAFSNTVCSQALLNILQSGESNLVVKERIHSRTIMVSYSPIIQDTQVLGALCIFQDVTELDHLNNEFQNYKRSYQTLETVLDVDYEGIVLINQEGIIEWYNEAFAEFVTASKEKIIGQDIENILKDSNIKMNLRTGLSYKGQIMSKAGTFYIIFSRPISVDGVIVGAVVRIIFQQINELKDLLKRIDIFEKQTNLYQRDLTNLTGAKFSLEDIVTVNEAMKKLKEEIYHAARSNCAILIRGETGTGKELIAHTLHNCSYRFQEPFIKVNCAAIPDHLLESEFFGYEEGAFTGAKRGGKQGKFELANGGTLFLDEIGDMSLNLQSKLLRILEDNEVTRVGGVKVIKVNVRVIASTNRNLEKMIELGEFRQDLYYRLNVITLCSLPLRERRDDIPILVEHMLNKFNTINKKTVTGIDPNARALLMRYDWPGNIRELENVIERAVSLTTSGLIHSEDLPDTIRSSVFTMYGQINSEKKAHYKNKIHETEKDVILQALKTAAGNKTEAAKILGISRTALYQKLNAYNIKKNGF